MNIAYKYRIYPDRKQTLLIEKTFGCCRKVWNLMLSDKIAYYRSTGKSLMTTPAMYKKEYPYLKEADSLALANVQTNLQDAYKIQVKETLQEKLYYKYGKRQYRFGL